MGKKYETVGGQAVVEGVMMKSSDRTTMAVRSENDDKIKFTYLKSKKITNPFLKLPLVRGCVNFFIMLSEGIGYIDKSTKMAYEEDDDEVSSPFITFIAAIFGIVLSVVLFIFLPTLSASFFRSHISNNILINLIEGLIRIVIFIAYLFTMRLIPGMDRYFMYHGAEHKTIMCSEKGDELTVENVRKATRLHPRCGTTFMFLLMIISILVYSVIIWTDKLLLRTLFRILLLPVIAGISYEILKALAKTENKCFYIFKWPGLMLQKITTIEPTDDMIQVAIVAFKGAKLSLEEFTSWRSSENRIEFSDYEKTT